MKIAKSAANLKEILKRLKSNGSKLAFVPTMGALHDGHLSLIKIAKENADHVVVSIYVNPAQFVVGEDFDQYPRQTEEDLEQLKSLNADVVYTPTNEDIYPDGIIRMHADFPAAQGLESDYRPDFFSGVVTVVRELFDQVQPGIAVFGQKDYQQLCVIKQMVDKLQLPIKIIGAPTARDQHDLALSSRNAYLSQDQLDTARKLPAILKSLVQEIKDYPEEIENILPIGIQSLYEAGFNNVDYLELRASNSLKPIKKLNEDARLLTAVHLDNVRLIDNWEVPCSN